MARYHTHADAVVQGVGNKLQIYSITSIVVIRSTNNNNSSTYRNDRKDYLTTFSLNLLARNLNDM